MTLQWLLFAVLAFTGCAIAPSAKGQAAFVSPHDAQALGQTKSQVASAPAKGVMILESKGNQWIDGYFTPVNLSHDGSSAIIERAPGDIHLYALSTGHEDTAKLLGGLDQLDDAVFCGSGSLARLGRNGTKEGWFLPQGSALRLSNLPRAATPTCSSDGSLIAYVDPNDPKHPLMVGSDGNYRSYGVSGMITAMSFSSSGDKLYDMALGADGRSTLSSTTLATGQSQTLASDLDASLLGG